MSAKYDTIGINYSDLRQPDPRIAAVIADALGEASTVLNVGAGAGSYEPDGRAVTAVEPSSEMIRQRRKDRATIIQGSAEELPFDDGHFDASMAVLTIHHWNDQKAGMQEMRRATKGPVVLLTFDPASRPWLTDYLPELAELDHKQMPVMSNYQEWLGPVAITPMPIPHDCIDGFLYAYWRRPKAYCDPRIRPAISSFWALDDLESGLASLQSDLESGAWDQHYRDIAQLSEYDAGYRLVVSPGSS